MREQARIAIEKLDETPRRKQGLRLWLRLLTTSQLIEKDIRGRFRREFASTLPRFDCLAALAREPGGQTMGDVSRWLLVSSGNISGIVARLEEEGLVMRSRSQADRRSHRVRLTAKGRAQFEKQSAAHERWIKEILGGLSSTEMAGLHRLLEKIKTRLAESEA